ncbi:MAG: hypothetical protein JW955_24935 [Sedimentisphaerales bacterium]|nr:hypothetical protein [Sedimentisphaerales bacterium]
MGEQEFRVFYAWQSDSSHSTNRNFIETAIDAALKNMRKTGIVEASPRLDKDTKDVPGIPDIANTILEKIRSAGAFVADISFVGQVRGASPGSDKIVPNPNVMIELGYALAELGWERIACVLNTDSGLPDNLPFDLRHRRWPITYKLAKDADPETRSTQKRELVNAVQRAIEAIARLPMRQKEPGIDERMGAIEKAMSTLGGSFAEVARIVGDSVQASAAARATTDDPTSRSARLREDLIERINAGQFEGMLAHQPSVVLSISPVSSPANVGLFDPEREKMLVPYLLPLYTSAWDHRVYGDRFVTSSRQNEIVYAATEIDQHGVIRAANLRLVRSRRKLSAGQTPDDTLIIPSVTFEKGMVEGIARYIKALVELTVAGPWVTGIGLIGLTKSALGVAPRLLFDGYAFERERILPPPVMISADTDLDDLQAVARAMRPAFDYVWREYNYPQSLNYAENGDWVGH